MIATIVSGSLKIIVWSLALVGLGALALTAMLANPLVAPPELRSISSARGTIDMSTLPPIQRFQARDGTALGFRHYAALGAATGRIAVVVHGSSGSSGNNIHAVSWALAQRGVESYALDIRGHGVSGTRGDIGYIGQLEDDLADFVAELRKTNPDAPLTLIGHSSGGGFALRVAGSPIQNLFARTVLLAPYLGYDAPTTQPNSGGWANADVPRILATVILRQIGITCCDSLPVVAFAVPPNSAKTLVPAYTERLRSNFGTHPNFRTDLAAATRPVTIFAGADDELMIPGKYAAVVQGVGMPVDVKLIPGANHMGIVGLPAAVSAIAEDVATRGVPGS
jgi:alpha-beta hydrolase superfamily lysophospholipase